MNPPSPENPLPARTASGDDSVVSLAEALANKHKRLPVKNRRLSASPVHRLHTAMLIASTVVAAVFCMLYITKPVIYTVPESAMAEAADSPESSSEVADIDAAPGKSVPTSPSHDGHEETNLRVQHVLNATTADGDLSRIVLDVPVIYASRQLRWTDAEVAQARAIHARLADFHEQSRQLRGLGADILTEWNELIERSIPTADLRADSPSLPANQDDAAQRSGPATLDTTEVIEIQPSGP
ncbi:MAG: hypothetical protein ACNA8L_12520 [Luteolibacter sp.]